MNYRSYKSIKTDERVESIIYRAPRRPLFELVFDELRGDEEVLTTLLAALAPVEDEGEAPIFDPTPESPALPPLASDADETLVRSAAERLAMALAI